MFFCEYFEIFMNSFFYRIPSVAAFASCAYSHHSCISYQLSHVGDRRPQQFSKIISDLQDVRTIAPEENWPPENCPLDDCPPLGQLPPREIAPRTIASWIIAFWMIPPRLLFPDNYPKDNCPLTISPWNRPQGKLLFEWFVAYINAPPSLPRQESSL